MLVQRLAVIKLARLEGAAQGDLFICSARTKASGHVHNTHTHKHTLSGRERDEESEREE